MATKRIAIATGGGDAPGLNAVIRSVTLAALEHGWETIGIRDGYDGLLRPEKYPQGGTVSLTRDAVRGIAHLGGTIIGTTNRGNPFALESRDADGNPLFEDRSQKVVDGLKELGVDTLIAVGGDGSMLIADQLMRKGVRVVGVPKTIDNDLEGTTVTFGFDSAVAFATECIGRLHSTASAHNRVFVVEVMGRHAGWIALHTGIAGSADVILIPEIPWDIERVAAKVNDRNASGREYTLVVAAEGAVPQGGTLSFQDQGGVQRLGGVGEQVTQALRPLVPNEVRTVVLGHLLRGGTPTARDRLLAFRFGAAAVHAVQNRLSGVMVALDPPRVRYVPLAEATRRTKTVPLDCDTMISARDLGISFGD
jgi:6-phosphofructokinase 1